MKPKPAASDLEELGLRVIDLGTRFLDGAGMSVVALALEVSAARTPIPTAAGTVTVREVRSGVLSAAEALSV